MTCEELIAPLTAVLFAAGEPQTVERLTEIFDCGQDMMKAALVRLERKLESEDQKGLRSIAPHSPIFYFAFTTRAV